MQRIVKAAFGTQSAAAAALGRSQGHISKIVKAAVPEDKKVPYMMPSREFVNKFLDAVDDKGYKEENLVATTRRLYMAALREVDPVKYQAYAAEDDRAKAERASRAVIEALRQENAELADRSERLATENERQRREVDAFQAQAAERERGVRAEAERKIASLTAQLSAEREQRVSSAVTMRALRQELETVRETLATEQQARADDRREAAEQLAEARARLEELANRAAVGLVQRQELEETVLSLQAQVALHRAEEARQERESAVLAEAVAVTEQALHSSIEVPADRAAPAKQSKKAPMTVLIMGVVIALLGALTMALSMRGHSLAAHSAVIAALDHNAAAAYGGMIAALVGVLLFGGSMMLVLEEDGVDTKDMCMATWI
ncbi:hypothetical protein ABZ330_36380 [Streptomyces sp. NPDC006172]|uniref:hypothetical protein n=1 Tax=Streptomyces sp. NPDC006172 TaxID=3154470 RepID=UPI0033C377F7